MFKINKNILFFLAIMALLFFIVILSIQRKKEENSFDSNQEWEPEVKDQYTQAVNESGENNLPGFMSLQYKISTQGKKGVFPMILEKITPGPIELPNRRSLLNKDAKYKFKDIMHGEKIKVVSLQNLSYTVDHMAFNDNFLVTDNDYLIAYTQAKEHFKLSSI